MPSVARKTVSGITTVALNVARSQLGAPAAPKTILIAPEGSRQQEQRSQYPDLRSDLPGYKTHLASSSLNWVLIKTHRHIVFRLLAGPAFQLFQDFHLKFVQREVAILGQNLLKPRFSKVAALALTQVGYAV